MVVIYKSLLEILQLCFDIYKSILDSAKRSSSLFSPDTTDGHDNIPGSMEIILREASELYCKFLTSKCSLIEKELSQLGKNPEIPMDNMTLFSIMTRMSKVLYISEDEMRLSKVYVACLYPDSGNIDIPARDLDMVSDHELENRQDEVLNYNDEGLESIERFASEIRYAPFAILSDQALSAESSESTKDNPFFTKTEAFKVEDDY